jgi:hypothetical protein
MSVMAPASSHGWYLRTDGASHVRAQEFDGASADSVSAATIGNGSWSHVAGTFNATTNFVYLNGVQATGAAARTAPVSVSDTYLGAEGAVGNYWSGDLAECAIWNVALTAADVAALALGVSPLFVRPDALIAYWPVSGQYAPEPSVMLAAAALTVTGATPAAHPRMFTPSGPQEFKTAHATAAVLTAASSFGVSVTANLTAPVRFQAAASFGVTVNPSAAAPTIGSTGEPNNWFGSVFDGGTQAPYPFANGEGTRTWWWTSVDGSGVESPLSLPLTRTVPSSGGPFAASIVFPLGPGGTASRNLYRSLPNGRVPFLVGTFANNTSTTFNDHVADGSLGAAAPTAPTGATLSSAAQFAAAPGVRVSVTANLTHVGATLSASVGFGFSTTATIRPYVRPVDGPIVITVNGVVRTNDVLENSLSIHDPENQPKTCSFVTRAAMPGTAKIVVSRGTFILFAGSITSVQQTYAAAVTNTQWNIGAINHNFLLRRRRPIASYTNEPADLVILDLMAHNSSGFTTDYVEPNLPPVTIAFNGSQDLAACIATVMGMIGGASFLDDRALHAFITDSGSSTPDALDGTGTLQLTPAIVASIDWAQIRTQDLIKGAATQVSADVLAGESILPLDAVDPYLDSGGQVFLEPSSVVAYTGRQASVAGSFVGPGVTPSTAPTVTPATGSGLGIGFYGYAVVDRTAAGPTRPGPVAVVQTLGAVTIPDPTVAPTASADSYYGNLSGTGPNFNATGHEPHISDTVQYAYRWSTSANPSDLTFGTNLSPASPSITVPAAGIDSYGFTSAAILNVAVPPNADPRIPYIHIFRKRNGGAWLFLNVAIQGSGANGWAIQDGLADGTLTLPVANAVVAAQQQVTVDDIALGASPTTSRDVYRTVAQTTAAAALTAQLKLLTNVANNTSTGPYTDSTADGSLGVNAPTSDTSGITQPSGQVLPGAVAIPTAGAGFASPGGGWVVVGSQAIRYAGLTGNMLTGIPPIGPGSIESPINYNATITALPALTGCTNVPAALKGTAARLYVVRDNLAAQIALAAIEDARPLAPGLAAPTFTPVYTVDPTNPGSGNNGPRYAIGDSVAYVYTYSAAVSLSDVSQLSAASASTGAHTVAQQLGGSAPFTQPHFVQVQHTTDPAVKWIQGWISVNGGPFYFSAGASVANNGTTGTTQLSPQPTTGGLFDTRLSGNSDGIHQGYIDDPDLLTVQACNAAGDKDLADFGGAQPTLTYPTRDMKTGSGKPLAVNLPTVPPIVMTLRIVDVTISSLWLTDAGPMYSCKAALTSFTFQDFLAQIVEGRL